MGTPRGKGLDLECLHPFPVKQIYNSEEYLVENVMATVLSSSSSPPLFNGNTLGTEDDCWNDALMKNPPRLPQELIQQYLMATTDLNAAPNHPAPRFSGENDENTVRQWQIESTFVSNDYSDKPLLKTMPQPEDHNNNNNNENLNHETIDKTVDRKQKRMMKNRESAALSRARKQAYLDQLQIKVKQLENINNLLRKKKEFRKRSNSNEPAGKRYQLRRTSSSSS